MISTRIWQLVYEEVLQDIRPDYTIIDWYGGENFYWIYRTCGPSVRGPGRQEWRESGQLGLLHREGDRPAVVEMDGSCGWWFHGQRHREGDQPAVVQPDGTAEWWYQGQRHREGGRPARVYLIGNGPGVPGGPGGPVRIEQERRMDFNWWMHGTPFVPNEECLCYEWWVQGQLHRDPKQGPAIMDLDRGIWEYWVHGKHIDSPPVVTTPQVNPQLVEQALAMFD
jgi:hypothetical protein